MARIKKAAKEALAPPVAHSRLSWSHLMYRAFSAVLQDFLQTKAASICLFRLLMAIVLTGWILCGFGFAAESKSETLHSLGDLLEMSPAELSKVDIAEMYLLCASGLPGVKVDIEGCRESLDKWAAEIRQHPLDGDNFKKSQDLLEVLKHDPRRFKVPLSMTMAYVSIGRRLGFPLKLGSANGISCVHWDDGKEGFNVSGLREDEMLLDNAQFGGEHAGPRIEVTPRHEKPQQPGNTQVLGVRDELSIFLGMRAVRLENDGLNADALVAFSQAHCLCPRCTDHLNGILRVAKKITPLVGHTGPVSATEARETATDEVERINRINKMNAELNDLQRQENILFNQQQMERRKSEQ